MKAVLNTMYITDPDMYLAVRGESILIKKNNTILQPYPLRNLQDIVLFTYLGMSPKLVQQCMEFGIGIAYMTPHGRFIGRLQGMSRGNILLRRTQYRLADTEAKALQVAISCIAAKVYNEKWTIERYIRQYAERVDTTRLERVSATLTGMLAEIQTVSSLDELRGFEGRAQMEYFSCMDTMILNQKQDFQFLTRSRRPPLTRVNAVLSFLYAVLANEIASALETVGLDAYAGFMHVDRPGRVSLALDMMEEFRAPLVDRLVLSMINRKYINASDFQVEANESVFLTDEGRRNVLALWRKRKQESITHPYLKEKMPWGLVPFVQATLLARYIRADLDAYPAFFWK